MQTYPLNSLSLEEAVKLQFKVTVLQENLKDTRF